MRLRNGKKAREKVKTYDFIYESPKHLKGKWKEAFGQFEAVELEIGMGKGDFLVSKALADSRKLFVGVERYETLLAKAASKIVENNIHNIILIRADATIISAFFEKKEVSKIYLNFSDPWPKTKYHKRRLTHINFLFEYKNILKESGVIEFKTDGLDFFEFSVEQIKAAHMKVEKISYDLHSTEFPEKNFKTEYEKKFIQQGKKINFIKATF